MDEAFPTSGSAPKPSPVLSRPLSFSQSALLCLQFLLPKEEGSKETAAPQELGVGVASLQSPPSNSHTLGIGTRC